MTHIISKDFLFSYSPGYLFHIELKKEIIELNKNIQLLREELKELKNIINAPTTGIRPTLSNTEYEEFNDYDFLPKINKNYYT